jgi:hypothetical protein
MRNTADVRYTDTSWQTAYPGHAVDLTELEFPPVRYDDGVDAALQLLDLGPSPRTDVVAELRDDLRDAIYAAEDLECSYSAVLYPEPDRTSDHVWVGFSVFDNRDEPLTPAEALADEVLDPAKHEVVTERIKDLDLPGGPAARLFQTTVTRDPAGASFQFVPRLTLCGMARAAGARYVIRGKATSASLVDTLDKVVMAWARGVSFSPIAVPGTPLVAGVPGAAGIAGFAGAAGVPGGAGVARAPEAAGLALAGTRPETAFHPGSTPLPPLG